MHIVVVFLFLSALSALIFVLFNNKKILASDQRVHLLYIDAIKKNKHKFILTCGNYLVQKKISYPQFIHWCLSFFSNKAVVQLQRYFPLIFATLSTLAFCFFSVKVYSYINPSFSVESFTLISGLIFVLTPFSYNINNAKNAGISARGLGVFFGQVYAYCLVLFTIEGLYVYLLIAFFCALIIILSNQLGTQYLLFATPLFSLVYLDGFLMIPLVVSILAFFLILPKVFLQFWVGQFGHKLFYFRHIYKTLLKYRASIWGDVFWYIWKLLITRQKPKGGGTLFMYIYTNSIIILIFMLPLTLPVLSYCIFYFSRLDCHIKFLFFPILIGLILFILFSFRRTRFLGEPERYVEFNIGFMAVLCLFFFKQDIYVSLIIYQVVIVVFQIIAPRIKVKVKQGKISNRLVLIENQLIAFSSSGIEVRLLSNNTEITRLLLGPMIKVFYGSVNTEMYGEFHYNELYHDFNRMKNEKIVPVINSFDINYFILDTDFCAVSDFEQLVFSAGLVFDQVFHEANLILYKVERTK